MNIAEILKDCVKGTKLYSLVDGEVFLSEIINNGLYPIKVITDDGNTRFYTKDGKFFNNRPSGECVLFPSKNQRDWSKFVVPNKHQFKPFDKVLVRNGDSDIWDCNIFNRIDEDGEYYCIDCECWEQCIPYEGNEHLLGTTNKPE